MDNGLQPRYEFSVADLRRAEINRDTLSRMIAPAAYTGNMPDESALLAALLQSRAKGVTRYVATPLFIDTFRLEPPTAFGGFIKQVLPFNPARRFLVIDYSTNGSFKTSFILFQQDQFTQRRVSNQEWPSLLQQALAIDIAVNFNIAGFMANMIMFPVAPINAISIMASTYEAQTGPFGVAIEGF